MMKHLLLGLTLTIVSSACGQDYTVRKQSDEDREEENYRVMAGRAFDGEAEAGTFKSYLKDLVVFDERAFILDINKYSAEEASTKCQEIGFSLADLGAFEIFQKEVKKPLYIPKDLLKNNPDLETSADYEAIEFHLQNEESKEEKLMMLCVK